MKIRLGIIEENIEAIKFWENIGFIYENQKIEDEKYNILIYEIKINTI